MPDYSVKDIILQRKSYALTMQTVKQCLVTAIFTHAPYPTSLYFEFFPELFFEHQKSKMSYAGRFLFTTDGMDIG